MFSQLTAVKHDRGRHADEVHGTFATHLYWLQGPAARLRWSGAERVTESSNRFVRDFVVCSRENVHAAFSRSGCSHILLLGKSFKSDALKMRSAGTLTTTSKMEEVLMMVSLKGVHARGAHQSDFAFGFVEGT